MRYTALDWETEIQAGIRRIPCILVDGEPAECVMTADTDAGYVDVIDYDNNAAGEYPTKRRYGVVTINFTYV